MTLDIVARAVLVAGSLLLVIGPGLQARLEMHEYHDLLAALGRTSDLPALTRDYLGLLAIGPSSALHSPLGALRFAATLSSGWYARYRGAKRAFETSGAGADERVVEVRIHLTRARNWAIVVCGSVLLFAGASVELGRALANAQGA